jgi:hypothetical protein
MIKEWTSPSVFPYQLVYHVDAKAETLPDDPGEGYEGECELFRITYGPRSEPRYDIICRGKCSDGKSCRLDVRFNGPTDVAYRQGTYTFSCACPKAKARKAAAGKKPTKAKKPRR